MITAELRAEIRRLFYAEHWKVGTIAAALKVHGDTVRHAIEADRFLQALARPRPTKADGSRSIGTERFTNTIHYLGDISRNEVGVPSVPMSV